MNRDELSCAGSVSSPDPLAVTFNSTTYIYMMCTTQNINNMGNAVITKYILTYQMFSDASWNKELLNDYYLTPDDQYFSYFMERTIYISMRECPPYTRPIRLVCFFYTASTLKQHPTGIQVAKIGHDYHKFKPTRFRPYSLILRA